MNTIEKIIYPQSLNQIFNKLKLENVRPIIVGGFIRDSLLHVQSKDIDIELYGISSFEKLESILEEFGSVNSVGKCFGVCKLHFNGLDLDFSLPRKDNKIGFGHKGFEIEINSSLDFKEAASRRDFTINAIAYDVLEKQIIDPFNGIKDLDNKLLKVVDKKKFSQDPLRVLRTIQFYARFDLRIDSELFTLCESMIKNNLLDELPKDRVFGEIKKLILKSSKPSKGFKLLKEFGGLKYLSPLEHLSNNQFYKILDSLDNIVSLKTNSNKTNIILMLSVLCSEFDSLQTMLFISKLTNEKELLTKVLSLTQTNLEDSYTDTQLFKLALEVNIEHFLILQNAINIIKKEGFFNRIKARAISLGILNQKLKMILKGRDILEYGIKPSKEYSTILNDAYEAQMNLEIKNIKEAKIWLKNRLIP